MRLLAALRDVLLEPEQRARCWPCSSTTLHDIDEEIAGPLGRARARRARSLAADRGDARRASGRREASAALASLRGQATRMRLLPLTPSELLELLRSVFGQVPYLERLAERLHRASDGNPAYCLELAQHLVHSGLATYQDGTWNLPRRARAREPAQEPASGAHRTARAALRRRAQARAQPECPARGRAVARAVCRGRGPAARSACTSCWPSSSARACCAYGSDGYRFAHEDVQTHPVRRAAKRHAGSRTCGSPRRCPQRRARRADRDACAPRCTFCARATCRAATGNCR